MGVVMVNELFKYFRQKFRIICTVWTWFWSLGQYLDSKGDYIGWHGVNGL